MPKLCALCGRWTRKQEMEVCSSCLSQAIAQDAEDEVEVGNCGRVADENCPDCRYYRGCEPASGPYPEWDRDLGF